MTTTKEFDSGRPRSKGSFLRSYNPLALLLALFVAIVPMYGQSDGGQIIGQVSNAGTDAMLEGVRVTVTPGDHVVYTRRGGQYRVTGLASGEYRVSANYTGMDVSSTSVKVTSGAIARQNFKLSSEIYELQPLRIAGEREGSAVAITLQRNADNVKTILDSESFGSIAKANIGNFLQRVPGLVGDMDEVDSDGVGVRGFQPHLSEVQFDGTLSAHAETGSNQRSVRIDAMQAELVKRVEVTKAPLPDQSAGSAGGTVNLISKSAFDFAKPTNSGFNMSLTKDYTTGEAITPGMSTYYSDIMGKNDNIGVFLLANLDEVATVRAYTRKDTNEDWDFESPYPTFFNMATYDRHHQTRQGASAKIDVKLDDDRLSMLHFKVGYTQYDDDMHRRQSQFDNEEFDLDDDYNWTIDPNNPDITTWEDIQYQSHQNIREETTQDWNFMAGGEHEFGQNELDYTVSVGNSQGLENRIRFTAQSWNSLTQVVDSSHSIYYPELTLTGDVLPWEEDFSDVRQMTLRKVTDTFASDEIINARINLKRNFDNGDYPFYIKTGLETRNQTKVRDDAENRIREIDDDDRSLGIDFSDYVDNNFNKRPSHGNYPYMNHLDLRKLHAAWDDGTGHFIDEMEPDTTWNARETYRDDRTLEEDIMAAYLMGNVDINRVAITGGVRFEETSVTGTSPVEDRRAPDAVSRYANSLTTEGKYDDFFPSIHFKWEPVNDLILRATYNSSIGRPDMGEIVSRIYEDEDDERLDISNPALKPQYVDSYEVSLEKYFEPAGMVSVSFFTKEISDLIYRKTVNDIQPGDDSFYGVDTEYYAGWRVRQNLNGGDGQVDGIELSWSQQFSFLPSFWKGFGIYANYTYLDTIADYDGDGQYEDELQGFKPRTANLGINFERGRFSARAQWNYVGAYLYDHEDDASRSRYYDKRLVMDWNTRYTLNENYTLFLDATNLGGEHREGYYGVVTRQREVQGQSSTISMGIIGKF